MKPVSQSAYVCADSDLGQVLRNQQAKMETLADSLPPERILGRSIDELQAELIAEFRVNPLSLDWDAVTADQGEAPIDVSRDPLRAISDRSRPFHLTGTVVTYFVPFEGDTELFKCRPSTFTTVFPTGRVRNGHVELRYQAVNPTPESVKRELDAELAQLRQWVGFVNADVAAFNAELPAWTRAVLERRLAKVRADQDLVASLGVPLRRREDAPTTYVAPAIRRKANIRPVRPIAQRAVPHEPVMAADEYEHILGVIQNMVEVMERSPTAFAAMKEEHLRDHFLVQLNSQYEGGATGETFNFEGKTDILVRVDGRTVFIAECKFWDGPQLLSRTIDQLLGYTSWRDTKTAILIFNRKRALSSVLPKISETVAAHPSFIREIPQAVETVFRFVLHHRDDPERELTLSVLVFELPGAKAS